MQIKLTLKQEEIVGNWFCELRVNDIAQFFLANDWYAALRIAGTSLEMGAVPNPFRINPVDACLS